MKRWLVCWALLAPAGAQAAAITDIRLWTAPDHTRVVFDLDARIHYRVFVLHSPERVVVDMKHAVLKADPRKLPVPDAVVERVRVGRPKPRTLRVVLDVKEKVRPRSFLLKPMHGKPHRLVVDLMRPQAEPVVAAKGKIVIAVDAGHGGEDPGAIGPHGVKEKDITLAVARALAREIDRTPGLSAFLTRDGDYFVPLRKRIRLARRAGAQVFISIHADAVRDRHVKGASVYLLAESGATPDRAAEALAAKENASDAVGGEPESEWEDPTLRMILGDMLSRATIEASAFLAKETLRALEQVGPLKYRQPKRARFVVLGALEIPSVLVELDYLSNPRRERLLKSPRHQKKLARALARGLWRYLVRMGMVPGQPAAEARTLRSVVDL